MESLPSSKFQTRLSVPKWSIRPFRVSPRTFSIEATSSFCPWTEPSSACASSTFWLAQCQKYAFSVWESPINCTQQHQNQRTPTRCKSSSSSPSACKFPSHWWWSCCRLLIWSFHSGRAIITKVCLNSVNIPNSSFSPEQHRFHPPSPPRSSQHCCHAHCAPSISTRSYQLVLLLQLQQGSSEEKKWIESFSETFRIINLGKFFKTIHYLCIYNILPHRGYMSGMWWLSQFQKEKNS